MKKAGKFEFLDEISVFRTSVKNFDSDNSTFEFHTRQIPGKVPKNEKLEIRDCFYWKNPFPIPACKKVIDEIEKHTTSKDCKALLLDLKRPKLSFIGCLGNNGSIHVFEQTTCRYICAINYR